MLIIESIYQLFKTVNSMSQVCQPPNVFYVIYAEKKQYKQTKQYVYEVSEVCGIWMQFQGIKQNFSHIHKQITMFPQCLKS